MTRRKQARECRNIDGDVGGVIFPDKPFETKRAEVLAMKIRLEELPSISADARRVVCEGMYRLMNERNYNIEISFRNKTGYAEPLMNKNETGDRPSNRYIAEYSKYIEPFMTVVTVPPITSCNIPIASRTRPQQNRLPVETIIGLGYDDIIKFPVREDTVDDAYSLTSQVVDSNTRMLRKDNETRQRLDREMEKTIRTQVFYSELSRYRKDFSSMIDNLRDELWFSMMMKSGDYDLAKTMDAFKKGHKSGMLLRDIFNTPLPPTYGREIDKVTGEPVDINAGEDWFTAYIKGIVWKIRSSY